MTSISRSFLRGAETEWEVGDTGAEVGGREQNEPDDVQPPQACEESDQDRGSACGEADVAILLAHVLGQVHIETSIALYVETELDDAALVSRFRRLVNGKWGRCSRFQEHFGQSCKRNRDPQPEGTQADGRGGGQEGEGAQHDPEGSRRRRRWLPATRRSTPSTGASPA